MRAQPVGSRENYMPLPVLEVDGQAVRATDEPFNFMVRLEVEDNLLMPDTFSIRFRDPRHNTPDATPDGASSLLQSWGFKIGTKVKISAQAIESQQSAEPLISGEVTAIEAVYSEHSNYIVVRGYDPSHRLHRGRKTESKDQVTDGDLVRQAASDASVDPGTIDTGSNHQNFSRLNLTGWELVQERARALKLEAAVVEDKLEFRQPTQASAAPSPGGGGGGDPKKLVWGDNLVAFRPRLTAPQHNEVEVRGWDWKNKKELKAKEAITSTSAALTENPAGLAGKFGTATYLHTTPLHIQGEVDSMAKSLAEQIGTTFAEAEAETFGDPNLKAGSAVSVEAVSPEFRGKWTITGSRHEFGDRGYFTYMSMRGRQDRSLLGLASGEPGNGALGSGQPIYGVVVGIVSDAKDPDKLGRVKVKFPWLSDTFVSDWAWVTQLGAGASRGAVIIPEVNDTVLVAFLHGNPRYPYVIGGLYNGQDKPDPELDGAAAVAGSGEINRRGFVSRTAHRLIFSDESGKEYVELSTKDKKFMLKLDQAKTQIEITSDGKITITGKQDITVKGDANIKVEAGGNLEEKATGNAKIEATGNLELKGAMVKIEGSGPVEIKGAVIKLN